MNSVLFCPKPYFKVVKQENKVHHVKLGIFHPIYIWSLLNLELWLFSFEIKHFNMEFMQNKLKQHFKHGWKWQNIKLDEILRILHI